MRQPNKWYDENMEYWGLPHNMTHKEAKETIIVVSPLVIGLIVIAITNAHGLAMATIAAICTFTTLYLAFRVFGFED